MHLNILKIMLVVVLAFPILVSCIRVKITPNERPQNGVEIDFSTGVTRAAVGNSADPKAGMSDFSVWGWYSPTGAVRATYTYLFDNTTINSVTGEYAGGPRYWSDGNTYGFCALHPAGLAAPALPGTGTPITCTPDGKLTVREFDSSKGVADKAIDLMSACFITNYVQTNTPEPVALNFSHELAQVEFILSAAQDVTVNYIRLTGVGYKGTMTATANFTGTLPTMTTTWDGMTRSQSNAPFAINQAFNIPQQELNQQKPLFGGYLLLPPQNLVVAPPEAIPTFSIQWVYTGITPTITRTLDIPLKDGIVSTWEKGKRYRYHLPIPQTPIDAQLTVSVLPWNHKHVDVEW